MDRLAAHLRELERADVVAFGGVGFAGELLPVTRAYEAVAGELTDGLRPDLDHLLERGTPAGKVYAAVLLGRLDPAAGRAAWRRLAGDQSPVATFTGCIQGSSTLGEYAAAQHESTPG
jgi:hypothetical protein